MKCTVALTTNADLQFTSPTGRELTVPFDIARTEVPWHDPDNDLANLWKKRALTAEAAFFILRQMLMHGEEHDHKSMAYPTQHILDAWKSGKRIDWTKPEPTVVRTVIGDADVPVRKRKPSAKAFKEIRKGEKAASLALVDLSKVEFTL